ncbi:hypothetical protein EON73_01065 [bacterium]|nr:MAG: hypothetical protein EON73_01065 [bacterium]
MTNVKISSKGQAFLSKGYSSMELAKVIAASESNLSLKEGVVVKIGKKSISARSVAQKAFQSK